MRVVALLLAASAAAAAAPVKNPGTFVYAIVGDLDSVDPHYQYDGISFLVQNQIYEGLVGYDDRKVDVFQPRLAAKIPTRENGLISKDGRTYTFPVREGVRFHNGEALSAEDVRYSLLRFLLQDRDGGPAWLLLEPILGVSSTRGKDGKPLPGLYAKAAAAVRVRGGAVVVTLEKPFAPFLSILASYGFVVSKRWAAANGDWDGKPETWARYNNPSKESSHLFDHANGTGPFELTRWDRRTQQVVLSRNAGYWRAPATLERVILKTVNEFSTRKLLLQGGDADAIFADRSFLPQLASIPGVEVRDDLPFLEVHNHFSFTFKVNPSANPMIGSGKLDGDGIPYDFFADRDVRLAFAYAFPYQAYIDDVYRGKGRRARGPVPYGLGGHDEGQAVREHDLKKAEEHFRKALGGALWDKGFRFTLAYQEGKETRGQACRILKSVIERLNPKFKIDVRGLQWSTMLDLTTKHKVPMYNARWGLDYPDAHNCVQPYLHSEGHYAASQRYKNPKMDALIEQAAVELAPQKRNALYRRIFELAYEDVPQIYTLDTVNFRVQRSWIKNFPYNPMLQYGYFYPVTKG